MINRRQGTPISFRIGSVPYLNAAPLTWGLEDEIRFLPPSTLGQALRRGELDVALLSITEALFQEDYHLLDGIGVCSKGPVNSVFLAHQGPLADIQEVYCDTATLTSINLLRVLLANQGLTPALRKLESYDQAPEKDNVLLIGNPAIRFRQLGTRHHIWDLGQAWHEMTGLPFVFAAWVLRRGRVDDLLCAKLRKAKRDGMAHLDDIIAAAGDFDEAFRRRYLTQHIHYDIGEAERQGIDRFKFELGQFSDVVVHDPQLVGLV